MHSLTVLRDNPLFLHIDDADLSTLLNCLGAGERQYRKGNFVIDEGDPARWVGLVLEGSVHVLQHDFWGNTSILQHVGVGGLFGEAFCCADADSYPVSVEAVEDTRVLLIEYRRILTQCRNACGFHARMIENMLLILAQKNMLLTRKIAHLTRRTTREKLLSYLSEQALITGNAHLEIPFNRQQLADYLAVDRSAMSSELSKMQAEGILSFQRNRFELLRPEQE